jgi:CRP-like cAMP-binding protein
MTHQSDTSSFFDRAQNDAVTTQLLAQSEAAAALSIDRQADAIAPQVPDDGARSATDDPVDPLALGELTCLRRGARLGRDEIYLLRDAVVSLSIKMNCHVALARNGDMAGLHQLLLPSHPEIVATVVKPGHAVLIQRDRLRRAMRNKEALYLRLLGYAFRMNAAYLSEAASSMALTVEQRVARWLARYATASQEAGIEITHQELATLLTIRRAGVTNALHILEGDDLLRSRRGRVEFLDLDRLAAFACLRGGDLHRSGAGRN